METPPPQPSPFAGQTRRLTTIRLGILSAGLAVALLFGNWIDLPGFSTCAFKIWTGRPCPGCGMTRSMVHLGGGDIWTSLQYHPLGLGLAMALVVGIAGSVIGLARGHDPVWALIERKGPLIVVGFVGALVGVWVLRVFVVPEWSPDPITPPVPFAWPFGR